MALTWALLLVTLAACPRPASPMAPVIPTETPFDPATVDLLVVADGDLGHLEWSCGILAPRAHDAVLALEAAPTKKNRSSRWRLHALAGECAEYLGNPMVPYYGLVNGSLFNLHDLRNAQLLREDPTLSAETCAAADLRRKNIEWLLVAPSEPASVDSEVILGMLRAPLTE